MAGLGAAGPASRRSTAQGIARRGSTRPTAASLAYAGTHVVLATGTASGKSLAYQLPALATLLADPRATALYLSPTKALAADQLRAVAAPRPRRGTAGHVRR